MINSLVKIYRFLTEVLGFLGTILLRLSGSTPVDLGASHPGEKLSFVG